MSKLIKHTAEHVGSINNKIHSDLTRMRHEIEKRTAEGNFTMDSTFADAVHRDICIVLEQLNDAQGWIKAIEGS